MKSAILHWKTPMRISLTMGTPSFMLLTRHLRGQLKGRLLKQFGLLCFGWMPAHEQQTIKYSRNCHSYIWRDANRTEPNRTAPNRKQKTLPLFSIRRNESCNKINWNFYSETFVPRHDTGWPHTPVGTRNESPGCCTMVNVNSRNICKMRQKTKNSIWTDLLKWLEPTKVTGNNKQASKHHQQSIRSRKQWVTTDTQRRTNMADPFFTCVLSHLIFN